MKIEPDDFAGTFKAMPVFSTMRANMAMVDAFLRRSRIEAHNYKDEDLGFLGVGPGEGQRNIHNRSVAVIVVALLYQTLDNYSELKRISPKLEDPGLEGFLNGLENADKFVSGMRTIRNGVFHVKRLKSWRSRDVTYFDRVGEQRGGVLVVMAELRKLLYEFTEKVFRGELRIWPDSVYGNIERWERKRPDLVQKLENGEIEFPEYMEAMLSSGEKSPRGG